MQSHIECDGNYVSFYPEGNRLACVTFSRCSDKVLINRMKFSVGEAEEIGKKLLDMCNRETASPFNL